MSSEETAIINAEIQAFVSGLAARGIHVVGGLIQRVDGVEGRKSKVTVFCSAPEDANGEEHAFAVKLVTLLYQTVTSRKVENCRVLPIGTN